METTTSDPLLNLRYAIASNSTPILTTSSDPPTPDDSTDISKATHIHFATPQGHRTFSLSTGTRFKDPEKADPYDLRSIYVAWLNKDVGVGEYISAVQALNAQLSEPVEVLPFGPRLDILNWLQNLSDESEYIQPLEEQVPAAEAAADIAAGAKVDIVPTSTDTVKGVRTVDARLQEIYKGERKVGDRNSVLRGSKPMDFTIMRKQAEAFIGRKRPHPGTHESRPPPSHAGNPALISGLKKPAATAPRRLEPIILLSPSASSLLRMSNIKPFLESGQFQPASGTSAASNILHTTRPMPAISARSPLRFILVDSPENFKPDYWQRVVAVFTTGQVWQFKSYRWTNPSELFAHALGIYVGWEGEGVPETVKGWGRAVKTVGLEKWTGAVKEGGRWRDREAVEGIWTAIEESMRARGWASGGPAR